jgi:DNA-binding response OmpR family regulator
MATGRASDRKQILLAESNPHTCREIAEMLRQEGHEVIEVCDEAELLARIARLRASMSGGRFFDVDLIVSDVHVLGESGLDMLTDLRKNDQQTPVILITAFGDQEMRMRASRLKPVTVLDKPFDIEALRGLIQRILRSAGEDASDLFL